MNEHKTGLGELPIPGTDTGDVLLEQLGRTLRLRFECYEEGDRYELILEFTGVRAHRQRAEALCTVWHIEDAYDTIAEVRDSTWLDELEVALRKYGRPPEELHHFMIYIDSDGCYEIIAQSWRMWRAAARDLLEVFNARES